MMRMGTSLGMLSLAVATASCAAPPPEELAGLWSAGPAACAMGVGVRFGADAIEVVYPERSEVLFERPRYEPEREGEAFRVRITYDLPRLPGGAASAGAHGVITLARGPGGGIIPATHMLADPRTGAVHARLVDDPALEALTLSPCEGVPTPEIPIRGRG